MRSVHLKATHTLVTLYLIKNDCVHTQILDTDKDDPNLLMFKADHLKVVRFNLVTINLRTIVLKS